MATTRSRRCATASSTARRPGRRTAPAWRSRAFSNRRERYSSSLVVRDAYTRTRLDRNHDFAPTVRAIPASGGASRLLIRDAQSPDWSSDGTRLAFASVRDRNGRYCGSDECWFAGEIYMARSDGGGQTRLTRNEGDDAGRQWSPDGSRILFTSDRSLPESDSAEVYSIAADGSCLTWLTNQLRYLRIRGALVAYYSPDAVMRVISGHAVTSIDLGDGNRLAAVRRVIRDLRPYRAIAPARLAPPRIPRALEPEGRFLRALRSFGRLRYSRC